RMDSQRVAAAVELAVNFILANLALGGDGHVEIDVTVAGVKANIGGEFRWDFERNVPVAGFQPPARGQRGTLRGTHFDVSVAGLEFKFIKAAVGGDVSIAGRSVQLAVDTFQVF